MSLQSKKRLGRGLAALIGEESEANPSAAIEAGPNRLVPIEFLKPNKNNPRKAFAEADLEDLSRSIADKGLLQPILVRETSADSYEIVAGERRWRAAQRAGLHQLPIIVLSLTDAEALEIALIENIQRADLNPLEEARAYRQLLDQFHYTQQQLAESLGKSRSHISNTMRLLTLPDSVRQQIDSGQLTAGHARALVATESPSDLAAQIIKLGLSVRQAEALTKKTTAGAQQGRTEKIKSADTKALEKQLATVLGLKVEISEKGQEGGSLTVTYKTLEQLDDICRRLQGPQTH